jgi:hypothetical protein
LFFFLKGGKSFARCLLDGERKKNKMLKTTSQLKDTTLPARRPPTQLNRIELKQEQAPPLSTSTPKTKNKG